jgi:hypothetical protein
VWRDAAGLSAAGERFDTAEPHYCEIPAKCLLDASNMAKGGIMYKRKNRLGGVMPLLRLITIIGLCGLLIACTTTVGNERIADLTQENLSSNVVKGRTTQAQIRQLYGDPLKTSFTDGGNEIWEYEFSRLQAKPESYVPYVNLIQSGAEGDKKMLVFFFDRKKVVQNYALSNSKVDINRGLASR